jgi:hypothetical protein
VPFRETPLFGRPSLAKRRGILPRGQTEGRESGMADGKSAVEVVGSTGAYEIDGEVTFHDWGIQYIDRGMVHSYPWRMVIMVRQPAKYEGDRRPGSF